MFQEWTSYRGANRRGRVIARDAIGKVVEGFKEGKTLGHIPSRAPIAKGARYSYAHSKCLKRAERLRASRLAFLASDHQVVCYAFDSQIGWSPESEFAVVGIGSRVKSCIPAFVASVTTVFSLSRPAFI